MITFINSGSLSTQINILSDKMGGRQKHSYILKISGCLQEHFYVMAWVVTWNTYFVMGHHLYLKKDRKNFSYLAFGMKSF